MPALSPRPGRTRRRLRALAAAAVAAALILSSAPAQAATTTRWADWTFGGSAGDYSGTVAIADAPALEASFTSDSRGGVGVISGASTWLAPGTPVGAKYGSSRDQPYLNLRPRADTPTGASTTTYTFGTPTPVSGWTFVLGDIDADQVAIRAVGPDGAELPVSALGFQSGFNYCAPGIAGKPSCTGLATDVPSWDAATGTLTGNADAADTSGAAAWFEPTEPISSLAFTFTRRAGLPVYQTWFASLARDVTGTVTDQGDGSTVAGVEVRLLDASGAVIATTTTDDGGGYSFLGVTATSGYTVEVLPPTGTVAVGSPRAPVDLTAADAAAAFVIRDIVPVPVSGFVRDADDTPLGGVEVALSTDIQTLTAVTASDGSYLIDDVPVGTWDASATAPEGYSVTDSPDPIVVPPDSEAAIENQNFTLTADPTLSGVVSAGPDGVAGVTVTAVGMTETFSTVTADDGTYAFPRIPAGAYEVTITVPPGFTADEPTQTITLAADETLDFTLEPARTGVITGTVTDDEGTPLADVDLTVDGPGTTIDVTTTDEGQYSVDAIDPGDYIVTVAVPEGYEASGPVSRPVTITAAGETVDASFALTAIVTPTPTPTPTPSDTPTPAPSAPSTPPPGALPATGGTDGTAPLALAGGLVMAGLVSIAAAHVIHTRRATARR